MPTIIQVSNLSKSYTITHEGKERYTALRDVMAHKVKKYFPFPRHCEEVRRSNLPTKKNSGH